jgi:ribonuclease HI
LGSESETCVGSRVCLVGVFISFEKNFYRLPFTPPPLSGSPYRSFTNNQAEYRAVLKGIKLLREVNAEVVEILGDSQLVIIQLAGEYECKDDILRIYHEEYL